MIEKIKKSMYLKQLQDTRVLGLLAFCVVALLVTWSSIKAIQTNYDLQKQISVLQQQNQVSSLVNQNLKLQNEYLGTDQYLELSARRAFGKAAPGETVFFVPKDVAIKNTVDLTTSTTEKTKIPEEKTSFQKNFEAWIDFFLHRQKTKIN